MVDSGFKEEIWGQTEGYVMWKLCRLLCRLLCIFLCRYLVFVFGCERPSGWSGLGVYLVCALLRQTKNTGRCRSRNTETEKEMM